MFEPLASKIDHCLPHSWSNFLHLGFCLGQSFNSTNNKPLQCSGNWIQVAQEETSPALTRAEILVCLFFFRLLIQYQFWHLHLYVTQKYYLYTVNLKSKTTHRVPLTFLFPKRLKFFHSKILLFIISVSLFFGLLLISLFMFPFHIGTSENAIYI